MRPAARGERRNETLGLYAPDQFMITLGPSVGLVDPDDLSRLVLDNDRLSVFCHEYLHHLHNISTIAGFISFLRTITLWWLFRETVGMASESAGVGTLTPDRQLIVEELRRHGRAIAGSIDPEAYKPNDVIAYVVDKCELTEESFNVGANRQSIVSRVRLTGTVRAQNGDEENGVEFLFGEDAILEGIAAQLDARVANGSDGSRPPGFGAPVFPYGVLAALGDHLAPGIDPVSLLKLALLALQTTDPAGTLVQNLNRCCAAVASKGNWATGVEGVRADLTPSIAEVTKCALETEIPAMEGMFTTPGLIGEGIIAILAVFRQMLATRLTDPFFDLAPFNERGGVNHKLLGELILKYPPCAILQQAAGDNDEIRRDTLLSFLPHSSNGVDPEDLFRAVQSALDFLLLHLSDTGFDATDEIAATECPFYTACDLRMRHDMPENCRNEPWKAAHWPGWDAKGRCWYGAGVTATQGVTK